MEGEDPKGHTFYRERALRARLRPAPAPDALALTSQRSIGMLWLAAGVCGAALLSLALVRVPASREAPEGDRIALWRLVLE